MKIALFTRTKKGAADFAVDVIKKSFDDVYIFRGELGESFPEEAFQKAPFDVVLSFLSLWLIPNNILESTKMYCLNFHPGSPEYPGIGCTNFAIYDGVREYGVTCHHMEEQVDSGNIVKVVRFPVDTSETLYSLTEKCYEYLMSLFQEIITCVLENEALPESSETWERDPYRRSELDQLCCVDCFMEEEEVSRRVKATTFPGKPGAFIKLGEHYFEYKER